MSTPLAQPSGTPGECARMPLAQVRKFPGQASRRSSRSADPSSLAVTDLPVSGGEMGAMIRSFDWSSTPLGTAALWPPSLRTALGIMLESSLSMAIAWGPELRLLYNDRYR